MDRSNWWQSRWFLALLIAISTVPLLWPETPPLVDVPGHMGRFRVQLDLDQSPELQRYFDFQWALVGNLGTDLLVTPLARLFGLELAVKLIVIAIPPLTVAGMFWLSREVHGTIPPTTFFAIPFVYSYSFNNGFLNYSLALACSLIAFAYWVRLTGKGRFSARLIQFIPISCALWVVHAFGWGLLGLMVVSSGIVRHRSQGRPWTRSILRSCASAIPLALPILPMALGAGSVVGGPTSHFFDLTEKLFSLTSILRDRWLIWDALGVAVALLLLGTAARDSRFQVSKRLLACAGMLLILFIVMPGQILGLSYANMRIAPAAMIMAILSLRLHPGLDRVERTVAICGLMFVLARLAGTTVSYAIGDRESRGWLTGLDHIPRGAAVLSLVRGDCYDRWPLNRHAHMGSFVITRRHGFSNDQWQAAGAQLLRVRYTPAAPFIGDRSKYVFSRSCLEKKRRLGSKNPYLYYRNPETALAQFPRNAFDYVWMIEPPEFDMKARPGLKPIWRTNDAVLYKVVRGEK